MNIPATQEDVRKGNVINTFPNRRQRHFKVAPSSTKIAKCSMTESVVYRTGKYKKKEKILHKGDRGINSVG